MAQSPSGVSGDQLTSLAKTFSNLQSSLWNIKSQHQRLSVHHHQQCSALLKESLVLLFKVIQYVNKHDKSLVDWHHRSSRLKSALKVVKLDRRTQAAIDKKNEKLKVRVTEVEVEFNKTTDTFDDGLEAINGLNRQFRHFSIEMVQDATKHANQVYESYDQALQELQQEMVPLNDAIENIQAESKPLQVSLNKTKHKSQSANFSKNYHNFISTVSSAAAGGTYYGSYLFPPLNWATGSLTQIAETNAASAIKWEAQIAQLEEQYNKLEQELRKSDQEQATIAQQLVDLKSQKEDCIRSMNQAQIMQKSGLKLRSEAHNNLEELRKAKIELGSTREKIKQIAVELHESGYDSSRREIAGRLREALAMILDVGKKRKVVLDQKEVDRALGELMRMDKETAKIVKLIGSTAE